VHPCTTCTNVHQERLALFRYRRYNAETIPSHRLTPEIRYLAW
jgi:hypothetical protein